MKTAIVGINWGDEGKGRMVDLISEGYDVVVRYQGGNNAGHTVVNEKGKFVLNLLPSGILREGVVNVMGQGMAVDIQHLFTEIERLIAAGVAVTPENLKISDRAVLTLPYHVRQDVLEEERLGDKRFGSTRRGIGPVYGDKYMKKAVRMGDLLPGAALAERVEELTEWKNLTLSSYGERADASETLAWLERFGSYLRPFIADTGAYLAAALQSGRNVLFEAQLGALRDVDFGIYPYTSSSSTLAAYAPIGAGVAAERLDEVIGVMKAYSTCVGEGPFVAEAEGEEAERLRKAGGEYGAATGRPRRVGAFDAVASRYGVRVQGATVLALTKLDVLGYLERIPVCVAYEEDGRTRTDFPSVSALARTKPVYEYLDGWKTDLSGCRKFRELPEAARRYVWYLEERVNCPIRYLSVGASREACIKL